MSGLRKLKHSFSKKEKHSFSKKELSQNRSMGTESQDYGRLSISAQLPEDADSNWNLSISAHPQEEEDDGLNHPNPYLNRSLSISAQTEYSSLQKLAQDYGRLSTSAQIPEDAEDADPNPPLRPRRPADRNELIRIANKLKNRKLPEGYEFDDDHVEPMRGDRHDRHVYIEEALKGAEMNQIWRQKIYNQCPEDDDEELREAIDNRMKLKCYHPDIAQDYWFDERYCILERREYEKDISTTQGFEVGYYPYLMKDTCGLIFRYYCPPDAIVIAIVSDDAMIHMYGLAMHAIQFYNSREQTNYSVVNVIKAMTTVAAGTWFYMTFQASIPCYGDHLRTFEAKLFESIPCPQQYIEVDFVRLKMGPGPSILIHEAYARESEACCSSSNYFF